jgi:hypothetical protein
MKLAVLALVVLNEHIHIKAMLLSNQKYTVTRSLDFVHHLES